MAVTFREAFAATKNETLVDDTEDYGSNIDSFGDQSIQEKIPKTPTNAPKKKKVRRAKFAPRQRDGRVSDFPSHQISHIISSRVDYLSKPKSRDVWNHGGSGQILQATQTYYSTTYSVYLGQLFKLLNLTYDTHNTYSYHDYDDYETVRNDPTHPAAAERLNEQLKLPKKLQSWRCIPKTRLRKILWFLIRSFIHSSVRHITFGVHSLSHHTFVFHQSPIFQGSHCISINFFHLSISYHFHYSTFIFRNHPKVWGGHFPTLKDPGVTAWSFPHAIPFPRTVSLPFHDEMNSCYILGAPFFKVHWIKDNAVTPLKHLCFKMDGLAFLRYVAVDIENTRLGINILCGR